MKTFTITERQLEEMESYALNCPSNFDHLKYVRLQQCLTLYSLIKLFESHGLEAPFELSNELTKAED